MSQRDQGMDAPSAPGMFAPRCYPRGYIEPIDHGLTLMQTDDSGDIAEQHWVLLHNGVRLRPGQLILPDSPGYAEAVAALRESSSRRAGSGSQDSTGGQLAASFRTSRLHSGGRPAPGSLDIGVPERDAAGSAVIMPPIIDLTSIADENETGMPGYSADSQSSQSQDLPRSWQGDWRTQMQGPEPVMMQQGPAGGQIQWQGPIRAGPFPQQLELASNTTQSYPPSQPWNTYQVNPSAATFTPFLMPSQLLPSTYSPLSEASVSRTYQEFLCSITAEPAQTADQIQPAPLQRLTADMRQKLLKDLAEQYRRNAEGKKGQLRQEAAQGQRRRRAAARLSATSDVHVEARSEDTQQGAQEQGSDVSMVEPTEMDED